MTTYKKTTLLSGKVKRGQKTTFTNTTKTDKLVDNEKLYQYIKRFIVDYDCNPKLMPITQYEWLGKAIHNIVTVQSLRPQFRYYPYRDDMVQSACLQVFRYLNSYKWQEYNNPVSWVIQASYFMFLQYINDERKQLYIKFKSSANAHDNYNEFLCANGIVESDFNMDLQSLKSNNSTADVTMDNIREWVKDYEKSNFKDEKPQKENTPKEKPKADKLPTAKQSIDEVKRLCETILF